MDVLNDELAASSRRIATALKQASAELDFIRANVLERVAAAQEIAVQRNIFAVDDPDHWVSSVKRDVELTGVGVVAVLTCETETRSGLAKTYRVKIDSGFWYMTAEELDAHLSGYHAE